MKHGKKILKLGRNASHRKATLQSMSAALLEHKRINTTFAKAKALRRFVEPIITHGKDDSTHSRRQAFRKLNDKEAVKTLYNEVAPTVGDRPGGYVRIVKLGQRAGDAAEMAMVELVDFNDVRPHGAGGSKRKTRRSRSRGGNNTAPTIQEPSAETVDETPAELAPADAQPDAPEAEAPEAEAPEAEAPEAEAPEAEAPEAEAPEAEAPEAEAPEAEAPEAEAPEVEAPEAQAEASQPADAIAADGPTPDAAGSVVVPPSGDDHPDAAQGADTGTGEPGPGADAENQGRSHDNR